MKNFLTIILCVLLASSVVACAGENIENIVDTNESIKVNSKYNKVLVVYFSRTGYNYPNQWLEIGHTARVAGFIKEMTGCDEFEIVPEVPYPDDYEETKVISTNERDNDLRPEFKGEIENIDDYDLVFIGGPVWYGGMPMIIHTFYDKYSQSLNGKTIAPFSTHAGSGLADAARLATSYCPDSEVLDGLAIQGTNAVNSKEDVKKWLISIGILEESSGVGIVVADSDERQPKSIYYSLSGVLVQNPENGIFVRVKDGTARKVVY